MARSRNIKPGFCENEYLGVMPVETRLLFAVLPMFADREGRLEDRPMRIRAQAFPYDTFDVEPMLQQLHEGGFILRYRVNNVPYIQIVNFSKHQSPHVKEAASTIPAPDKNHTSTVQAPDKPSNDTSQAPPDSLIPDSLEKPSGSSAAPTNPYPDDFEALWSIYPKRDGSNPKKAAFSAYRTRLKEGVDPEAIRAGVERYAVWCESRGKVGTETVMQTKRFFGPGKEWENPWPVAFQPVKLPKDTSAHWRARRAVELPEDFTDFDASLAEINDRLRARPDLRGGLE